MLTGTKLREQPALPALLTIPLYATHHIPVAGVDARKDTGYTLRTPEQLLRINAATAARLVCQDSKLHDLLRPGRASDMLL